MNANEPILSPIGRALGAYLEIVPDAVQRFHRMAGRSIWRGEAEIGGDRNLLACIMRRRLGLPGPAAKVPLTVTVESREDGSGVWIRDYGDRRFVSRFQAVAGREARIVERVGRVDYLFALDADAGGVTMRFEGWSLGALPLPHALGPRVAARESADEAGRYRFDVAVGMPLAGLVVSYRGYLEPVETGP